MEKKSFNIFRVLSNNMAWVILTLIVIFFGIFSNNFFSIRNLLNILSQNAYLLVAATGLTFLMMSGEMDLSVGYTMSLVGVVGAGLMVSAGLPFWLCMIIMIALAIFISILNTFLAIHLKLQILVITIAMMTVLQGLSYIISKSKTITGFPIGFKFIGQGLVFNVFPISIVIMFIVFFIMSFVLNKTYYGRYVYALGGNKESARLAGINIKKMRYSIAVIVGFFVGLADIMLISRLGSTQSVIGPGTEFSIITGIFLGGVSIRGGEGKLSGVFAGILCIALLSNGMQLANINIYYQYVVRGIIMISAIGFDVFQLNRRNALKKIKKA
ncbi:MAG: ABC transporter permease [Clostridiales bacterium]|nr:ABC transporter permease [Clostridiales bacterium]